VEGRLANIGGKKQKTVFRKALYFGGNRGEDLGEHVYKSECLRI
jgi:hypothetical protein